MTTTAPSPRISRSILAIVAGTIAIIVISLGTDAILHATGVYPPWFQPMDSQLWALALAYRVVYGVFGAHLTALLAPHRPLWHAMVMGGIGFGLATLGVAMHWNKGPEYGPAWFNLSLIAISLPCSWLGGKIRESQLRNSSSIV